jgi:hypothetical protein
MAQFTVKSWYEGQDGATVFDAPSPRDAAVLWVQAHLASVDTESGHIAEVVDKVGHRRFLYRVVSSGSEFATVDVDLV